MPWAPATQLGARGETLDARFCSRRSCDNSRLGEFLPWRTLRGSKGRLNGSILAAKQARDSEEPTAPRNQSCAAFRGGSSHQDYPFLHKIGIFGATAAATLCIAGAALPITNEQLLFIEAWRAVDRAYVDKTFNNQTWLKVREAALKNYPMATRQETYEAIRKILLSLGDPFTRFFEPAQYGIVTGSEKGAVTGVGIEVGYNMSTSGEPPPMVIISPVPDGPADRAGVSTGDLLVAIDGSPTVGLSLYEAGVRLQGEEGTKVVLTLKTSGGRTKEIAVVREKVLFNPVAIKICRSVSDKVGANGPVGYLSIARFSEQTPLDVKRALSELKAQGAQQLLIDIRNNGGGSFAAGVEVAKMLVDEGDIVLISDSDGVRDIYSVDGVALDSTTPMAILVNKGTASASEVFAGAVQDSHRGQIVGQRTFGKGLIQTLVPLSDGSGLAVTVAKYQTPSGRDINKIGIVPDVELPSSFMSVTKQDICKALQSNEAPSLYQPDGQPTGGT